MRKSNKKSKFRGLNCQAQGDHGIHLDDDLQCNMNISISKMENYILPTQ